MIRDWIESNFEGISTSLVGLISIALLGTLVGRALRYALNFIIGAGLNAESLGIFTFGLVLVRAGGILSSLGLRTASQRLIATSRAQGDEKRLFGVTILSVFLPFLLGSVLSLALYISWPTLNEAFYLDMPPEVRYFVFGIPIFATMDVGASASRGFKTTRYYVYVREIGQSGLAAILVVSAILADLNFLAIIVAYLLSLTFGTLLAVYYLYDLLPPLQAKVPELPIRSTLSVSIPLLIVAVAQYLVTWTDILMLGALRTSEEVGYYQVAFLYSSIITIVLFGVNSIFPTIVADSYENGEFEYLERVYSVVTKWGLYLVGLAALSILYLSEELLLIFGHDFLVSIESLQILTIGQSLAAAVGPASYMLSMSEFETYESYNSIALGTLNVVLNLLLIPRFGIEGAAVATAVSLILLNLVRLIQVKWLLGITPYNRRYLKGAVGLVTSGAVISLLINLGFGWLHPIIAVIIGNCSFVATMILLGFDKEDTELLASVS